MKKKKKKPLIKNRTITPKLQAASRENGKLGGRPRTTLPPKDLELMSRLISAGLTEFEICRELNIATSTYYVLLQRDDRFSKAIEVGREKAEERIRRSLFMKGTGFTYIETTREPIYTIHPDDIGNRRKRKVAVKMEMTVTKEITKFVPPDPNAAVVWMRLSDPKGFTNKYGTHEAEGRPQINNSNVTNVVNNAIKPEEITEEHRKEIIKNNEILKRNGYI